MSVHWDGVCGATSFSFLFFPFHLFLDFCFGLVICVIFLFMRGHRQGSSRHILSRVSCVSQQTPVYISLVLSAEADGACSFHRLGASPVWLGVRRAPGFISRKK